MPRYPVRGRTALVTGGGGGIGAATGRALHARGANVVLAGRRLEAVSAVARELGRERAMAVSADVTDRAALDDLVARTVERFGALDIVFANAGIAAPGTIAGIDPQAFEEVVEVNLLGVWRTVRAALPQVIAAHGHVLVCGSVYSYVNGFANAPYAASKAAIEQFARALRVELAGHGASAGVLYPGWVDTPMTRPVFGGDDILTRMRETACPKRMRGAVLPQHVASRAVDGIERRAAAVTVPGRWQILAALRGVINPLSDRHLAQHTELRSLLRQLEATGR
ncbi:short-chain dehydrogenase/reductase [Streptomyces candidus]|uniref:NAD(P)-dependent dehydrogenase (Short-subunit alcohol dehydrogenase family) n=1 Tax=Streptomyces candidus TaxID=67283 RepID=A0A7X0LSG1_9ACTN|nr:short-chain dehydrogenase/reductase [Streptomyces candidus]MBB6439648.1 NAD(P)-dependent dehydrogenase (short-subunit alcohol dehydrogenase family) [Streptomyces candidus]GHH56255.1 short-chain dehydrogenase [Streptomyces candidus]